MEPQHQERLDRLKKGLCVWGDGNPPQPHTPSPLHHHSVSTIYAFIVFTFHVLPPLSRRIPSSPAAAVASAVVADPPSLPPPPHMVSAHRVFMVSLGASKWPAVFTLPRWPLPCSTSILRPSHGCVRYSAVPRDYPPLPPPVQTASSSVRSTCRKETLQSALIWPFL